MISLLFCTVFLAQLGSQARLKVCLHYVLSVSLELFGTLIVNVFPFSVGEILANISIERRNTIFQAVGVFIYHKDRWEIEIIPLFA